MLIYKQFKISEIMELKHKKTYVTPTVQVVEVQAAGVVCASGGPFKGFNNNGSGKEQYQW